MGSDRLTVSKSLRRSVSGRMGGTRLGRFPSTSTWCMVVQRCRVQVLMIGRGGNQRHDGWGGNQRRTPLTRMEERPKSMILHVHVGVGSRKRCVPQR